MHQYNVLFDTESINCIPGVVDSSELFVLLGLRNLTTVNENHRSSTQTSDHTDICESVSPILQLSVTLSL